ncbi:DNA polymerase beta domain protein region [Stanieria cyanosphaera PCC 7437]|uniref:DNA polymerase beta domain protein region n=1 Tax=Stanieria cyanosphaera (strain ATCC 29371 / PCC 7437) TaxID=111780 RepID=K9XS31_STAC7|nr:nucleotidyltransferase family protein [Stanieria cyanosphaera]AFZ35338.1 DNA polymerase beta domain protein region [Stanieria cyanosphaera PCC 7437]
MGIEELLLPFRAEILKIAAKYGVYKVLVFGSVARGEARPDSDVDLLIEFEPQRTLLDQIALMQSLEELLGRKVDLTEPKTLHECIREKVLQEAIVL